MKILSLDISGNWKEGKGTTGIAVMIDGKVTELKDLKAADYESDIEYWAAHVDLISEEYPDHIVCEGYRLYHHKGQEASKQANSDLETPQLLGIVKFAAYDFDTPITIQYASEVKTRWSEDVLVRLGILEKKGNKHYWKGQSTVTHHRDAMKHALHFWRYGRDKIGTL